MELKKCPKCNNYTIKEYCNKCETKNKPESAHYTFSKIRNAPSRATPFKRK